MKNFETILADNGITLTDEQKTAITKAMGENYKPIADWQKQVDKVNNLTEQLNETKTALGKFDGVDPEALKNDIAALNQKLADKDTEYQQKIADRDFQDKVKASIAKYKGKNEKAIKSLLDMDVLKASKNQDNDLDAAMKALTEAEDSKMLFGESQIEQPNIINTIGRFRTNQKVGDNYLDDQYKGNPYYSPTN
jgi:hypothetical protein